jgi:hypothetical protein
MFSLNAYGNCRVTITVTSAGAARNISTASAKSIRLKRPDGKVFTKTAAFTSDGSNGKIYYIFESGILSMSGQWEIEAVITFASGAQISQKGTFAVFDTIQ